MDILKNIKKEVLEPKIYAILVHSMRGQVLHLGIHFTLDEAYGDACKQLETISPHRPGEAKDMDMWNTIPIRQVIAGIVDENKIGDLAGFLDNNAEQEHLSGFGDTILHSISSKPIKTNEKIDSVEQKVENIKNTKNELMQKLIEDGNIKKVEDLKGILDATSRRYVMKKIQAKKNLEALENSLKEKE
jgi:hypothetical protein